MVIYPAVRRCAIGRARPLAQRRTKRRKVPLRNEGTDAATDILVRETKERNNMQTDLEYAQQLDSQDELASYRAAFVHDGDLIYMDGNSLGRLPCATVDRMGAAVEQEWGHDLIRGWHHGWYDAPQRIGDKIAGLLGAGPGQVLTCDSTSTNLLKLTLAALALRPERRRIVSDTLNFPSDLYIIQGCIDLLGGRHELALAPSIDDMRIDSAALAGMIDEQTALVTLSHGVFKSGF